MKTILTIAFAMTMLFANAQKIIVVSNNTNIEISQCIVDGAMTTIATCNGEICWKDNSENQLSIVIAQSLWNSPQPSSMCPKDCSEPYYVTATKVGSPDISWYGTIADAPKQARNYDKFILTLNKQ